MEHEKKFDNLGPGYQASQKSSCLWMKKKQLIIWTLDIKIMLISEHEKYWLFGAWISSLQEIFHGYQLSMKNILQPPALWTFILFMQTVKSSKCPGRSDSLLG